MTVQYEIRREGTELVCWFVAGADWSEVERLPRAALEGDLLEIQITLAQMQCELHAEQFLPWIVPDDDEDPRICWTGPLASFGPVLIGFSGE